MLQFVLPILMAAASTAQTFFYPTLSSPLYHYGSQSSYYPFYIPTTYNRPSYFYPYSRTQMTMAYPTFMARSVGTPYDALKSLQSDDKSHQLTRSLPIHSSTPITNDHHHPLIVSHLPVSPGIVSDHQNKQVAVTLPATIAYSLGIPIPAYVTKDLIPTVASNVEPSIDSPSSSLIASPNAPSITSPIVASIAPRVSIQNRHISQPALTYAIPISLPSGSDFPVPPTFEYSSLVPERVNPVTVGITGGASFVPATAVPVDVKSGFDVPTLVTRINHEGKHNNFETKKSSKISS